MLDKLFGRGGGPSARFVLISVAAEGLAYNILSSGKIRRSPRKYLERVLQRYRTTESLRPIDYQNITLNASYTLALVAGWSGHAS